MFWTVSKVVAMLAFFGLQQRALARYFNGSGAGPELHRNINGEVLSEEHGYFSRSRLEAVLLDDQVVVVGLQQRKA